MSKVTLRTFCSRDAGRQIGDAMVKIITENREMFASCLNCAHFNEPYAWCDVYKGNPPPRIIVYSCGEHYIDRDDVPY